MDLLRGSPLLRMTKERKRDRMEQLAIQARLDTQERMGQVVDIKLVMAFLEDLVIRTRGMLMALPGRLARKLARKDAKTIASVLSDEIAGCLRELSEAGPAALRDLSKRAHDGEIFFSDEEWKEQETNSESEKQNQRDAASAGR